MAIKYTAAVILIIGSFYALFRGNQIDWQRQSDRYYGLFAVLAVSAMALIAWGTIT